MGHTKNIFLSYFKTKHEIWLWNFKSLILSNLLLELSLDNGGLWFCRSNWHNERFCRSSIWCFLEVQREVAACWNLLLCPILAADIDRPSSLQWIDPQWSSMVTKWNEDIFILIWHLTCFCQFITIKWCVKLNKTNVCLCVSLTFYKTFKWYENRIFLYYYIAKVKHINLDGMLSNII